MRLFAHLGGLAAAVLISTSASATVLTADFEASLDLPSFSIGPRVFQALGEDVAGAPDLTEANEISNPNGFSGHVDMDLSSAGYLTLTGQQPLGFADYQFAVFTVSNIVFDTAQIITGVSIDFDDILDVAFGGVVMPSISFTENSFTITYDGNGDAFQFFDGGVSAFQIQTSAVSAVPLPAGLPLLLTALGGMGLLSRRRKNIQA